MQIPHGKDSTQNTHPPVTSSQGKDFKLVLGKSPLQGSWVSTANIIIQHNHLSALPFMPLFLVSQLWLWAQNTNVTGSSVC